MTITVLYPPAPTLNVSVVTDKSGYSNRNKVYIIATVTDGTNRISGATAHLDLTTADGSRVSSDITTDVNGIARFQYSINTRRDGSGTYLVNVTASKTGYNSGIGAASFTATR